MKRSDFWLVVFIWTSLEIMVTSFIGFAIHLFNSVELWEQILSYIVSIMELLGIITAILCIVMITYSGKRGEK